MQPNRFILIVLIIFLLPCILQAQVSAVPKEREAVSYHTGQFQGQSIEYKAEVKEYFFRLHGVGAPAVSAMAPSYIKTNNKVERPVIFIFNGGPGASSSPLHLNAFGPMRIQQENDSPVLKDNPYCLLDQADLVFIDPPGTGFTRIFDSTAAKEFWDVRRDALLFIELIAKWRIEHQRLSAPVYICGESYGTIRAAMISGSAGDLHISGVIFLSSVFDMSIVAEAPGNDIPYILFLPSMAATAWYHKKADPSFKSAAEAYEAAIRFGLNEYIMALAKGINLPQKEKENVAAGLARLIGLPIDSILSKDLRISNTNFELMLLAKENKRIGQLNGQATGPLYTPGVKPPFDDPSFNLRPSTRGIAGRYFNEYLQFADTAAYKTLNLGVNSRWNWKSMAERIGYSTVTPQLIGAMNTNPQLHFLVAGGLYDLATPLYAARYILEHSGIDPSRITYANYPTGHSIFENEEELIKLRNKVADLIRKR